MGIVKVFNWFITTNPLYRDRVRNYISKFLFYLDSINCLRAQAELQKVLIHGCFVYVNKYTVNKGKFCETRIQVSDKTK